MALKRLLALMVVAGLFLLAACGDDDSSSGDGGSSETAAVTFETIEPSKTNVSIRGPSSIEAGVTEISLKNAGKRPHDAQLVRVDGKQTAADVIANIIDSEQGAPTPDWLHAAGGIGTTQPGGTSSVTQVLGPGTYYVVDTESSGRGRNAPSNAKLGAVAKFEVTGDEVGSLPPTDARILAEDYSFEDSGIEPGKNRVTFTNAGKELHHVIAFPLNEGATIADARKAFASEEPPKGPPPVDFERFVGTAVLDGGGEQVTELEFKKGRYALVCFISDRAGGPPHVAKGMISELDVQ